MKRTIKLSTRVKIICQNRLSESAYRTMRETLKVQIWILLFLATFVFVNAATAQDINEDEPIKVDTLLVSVPVIASDKNGLYVAGLKKENFSVSEDGTKRAVDFFADVEAPMNVAIIIDNSGSTTNFIDDITGAAHNFIKTLRPDDKAMIVSFDSEMDILADFTSDQKKLNKAISHVGISHHGGSDMQDAMYEVVTKNFASVSGRKAIIVLTDGGVVGRVISNKKLLDTLIESDVIVYPIIFTPDQSFSRNFHFPKTFKLPNGEIISEDEMRKRMLTAQNNQLLFMKALGTVTGGRLYESKDSNFKKTFQIIADELKKQYVVGFYPSNINDGKPHRVYIEVDSKDIAIRTKSVIRLKSAQN